MSIVNLYREIKARCDAATFGPWQWFGNTDFRNVYLSTIFGGRVFVMKFKRWGNNGAPTFQDNYGMQDLEKVCRYEVDPDKPQEAKRYRNDFRGIKHPDAEFIAQARTDLPLALKALELACQSTIQSTTIPKDEAHRAELVENLMNLYLQSASTDIQKENEAARNAWLSA